MLQRHAEGVMTNHKMDSTSIPVTASLSYYGVFGQALANAGQTVTVGTFTDANPGGTLADFAGWSNKSPTVGSDVSRQNPDSIALRLMRMLPDWFLRPRLCGR